jgi:endoglucanase
MTKLADPRTIGFIGAVVGLLTCGLGVPADYVSTGHHLYFARGINLSSAQINPHRVPGVYGRDFIYPSPQELDYYASKGFEVVRLPFRWERLQPMLFGRFDDTELGRIRTFVAAARTRNMRVILSPHNFGRYILDGNETLVGTAGVPIAAFADFMRGLAAAFTGDDAIYGLSLMNEPHDSQGLWKRTAQAGLDAIRSADRERLVLAPGDQWSEAFRWHRYNDDFLLDDIGNHLIYEAHQYFDIDHTGTYKAGYSANRASPDRGVAWVSPFVEWLEQHKLQGIITEFGVPNDDPRWLALADQLLALLARKNIPWTYWAGGPWWGDYPLSAEPDNGIDAPIMQVLTKRYPR